MTQSSRLLFCFVRRSSYPPPSAGRGNALIMLSWNSTLSPYSNGLNFRGPRPALMSSALSIRAGGGGGGRGNDTSVPSRHINSCSHMLSLTFFVFLLPKTFFRSCSQLGRCVRLNALRILTWTMLLDTENS